MKRWLAIGGTALGVGLIGYAIFASESDEELIRKKLEALEQAAGVEGPSNPVVRGAQLNKQFAEIFDKDVRVNIPELTSLKRGRKGLVGIAAKAGTYAQELDIDFANIDVQLQEGATNARVTSTAKLTAVRRSGRLERDDRFVSFQFSKDDGEWMIWSLSVSPKGAAP